MSSLDDMETFKDGMLGNMPEGVGVELLTILKDMMCEIIEHPEAKEVMVPRMVLLHITGLASLILLEKLLIEKGMKDMDNGSDQAV